MQRPLVAALALVGVQVHAQPYTDSTGHTRHRFAQLELGLTQYYSPQSGRTQVLQGTALRDAEFGATSTSAIFIGGTHFWGHADLAVTIPLRTFGKGMRYGADLQAKYLPWRMEQNRVRPYVGLSMNPFRYAQNGGGEVSRTYFPVMAGLDFFRNGHQLELGAVYNYNNTFPYYVTRTQVGAARVQPRVFSTTYKYTLETTAGGERPWRNGSTARRTKVLADSGRLNNLSVAVGPTSSFRIASSDYLSRRYPFAGQHSFGPTFDYALGYYWHKSDVHVNLAYRAFTSNITAYGYTQQARRKATTFEAFKFLGDYNGFVPFIGPSISYERLSARERDGNVAATTDTFRGFRPGVTFGWDIRPDRLQSMILRTNLRWAPNLDVTMGDGSKSALDQLEFNFIQLVVYPDRMFRT